ncbi:MAG: hypothetical protein ACOYY2_11225 [Actinomycetota bacterium]
MARRPPAPTEPPETARARGRGRVALPVVFVVATLAAGLGVVTGTGSLVVRVALFSASVSGLVASFVAQETRRGRRLQRVDDLAELRAEVEEAVAQVGSDAGRLGGRLQAVEEELGRLSAAAGDLRRAGEAPDAAVQALAARLAFAEDQARRAMARSDVLERELVELRAALRADQEERSGRHRRHRRGGEAALVAPPEVAVPPLSLPTLAPPPPPPVLEHPWPSVRERPPLPDEAPTSVLDLSDPDPRPRRSHRL